MSQIEKTYLYGISHKEIPIAQQAIQSAHAILEYGYEHGRPIDHHPSVIYLTIKSKKDLEFLREKLNNIQIKTSEFHEPYQDWGLTAIACLLTEEDRGHLRHLQLWKPHP